MLRRHYKRNVSGFKHWEQLSHAEEYLLYPQNITEHLSIDELSLSKGELYTFVTNKQGKGKKKSLVAVIKDTKSQDIINVLNKVPLEVRRKVKSITLDMANNMESAARMCFPESDLTTDRFHVVRMVIDALQHLRIKYRWEEIEKENEAIKQAKKQKTKYQPLVLSNGDTPKQLLARSRYILAKKPNEWTLHQKMRADILFELYPKLLQAYKHTLAFRNIYENSDKMMAKEKFLKWIESTKELELNVFNTATNSLKHHMDTILNFFNNRLTNANAESFNSKIKQFRANLRGVIDTKFFLFRMEKLFA